MISLLVSELMPVEAIYQNIHNAAIIMLSIAHGCYWVAHYFIPMCNNGTSIHLILQIPNNVPTMNSSDVIIVLGDPFLQEYQVI